MGNCSLLLFFFLVSPIFSSSSLQAGWKKRHTIKLSKQHLLLTPSSPEFIPSLSSSLSLALSFLLPSIRPSSTYSNCTRKLCLLLLQPPPPLHPHLLKKQKKSNAKMKTRTNYRGGEDGGRGGFVKLPCPLRPSVPFFSIQSLYSTSLPVTLFVPMLITTLLAAANLHMCTQTIHRCVDLNKKHNDKNNIKNLTVPMRSLLPSRTTMRQLSSRLTAGNLSGWVASFFVLFVFCQRKATQVQLSNHCHFLSFAHFASLPSFPSFLSFYIYLLTANLLLPFSLSILALPPSPLSIKDQPSHKTEALTHS